MKRSRRIALEVLGPPLIGATLLGVGAMVATREVEALGIFPLLVVFGYLVAGLPSLAFAAIMELAFAKGLDPRSGRSVLLCAALGSASGLPIGVLMAGKLNVRPSASLFMLVGLVTGGAIGLLVRRWSRAAACLDSADGTPHRQRGRG